MKAPGEHPFAHSGAFLSRPYRQKFNSQLGLAEHVHSPQESDDAQTVGQLDVAVQLPQQLTHHHLATLAHFFSQTL